MDCRLTVQRRRGPLSLLRGGGQRGVRGRGRDGHAGEGVRMRGEDDGRGHARRLRGGERLRGRVRRDGLRERRERERRCGCFCGRVGAGRCVLCRGAGEGHARTCGGRGGAC